MLINSSHKNGHVKFVSYTGRYPNLCRGVLTLLINGKEEKFGHESKDFMWSMGEYNDTNYGDFWCSGGELLPNYSGTKQGEWIIDEDLLPESLKKYSNEIDRVFNENVSYGCCGGCI